MQTLIQFWIFKNISRSFVLRIAGIMFSFLLLMGAYQNADRPIEVHAYTEDYLCNYYCFEGNYDGRRYDACRADTTDQDNLKVTCIDYAEGEEDEEVPVDSQQFPPVPPPPRPDREECFNRLLDEVGPPNVVCLFNLNYDNRLNFIDANNLSLFESRVTKLVDDRFKLGYNCNQILEERKRSNLTPPTPAEIDTVVQALIGAKDIIQSSQICKKFVGGPLGSAVDVARRLINNPGKIKISTCEYDSNLLVAGLTQQGELVVNPNFFSPIVFSEGPDKELSQIFTMLHEISHATVPSEYYYRNKVTKELRTVVKGRDGKLPPLRPNEVAIDLIQNRHLNSSIPGEAITKLLIKSTDAYDELLAIACGFPESYARDEELESGHGADYEPSPIDSDISTVDYNQIVEQDSAFAGEFETIWRDRASRDDIEDYKSISNYDDVFSDDPENPEPSPTPVPTTNANCSIAYTGTHDTVGLPEGDPRFLCFNNRWYDCGWERNEPNWETKVANDQSVGSFTCNLEISRWTPASITPLPPPDRRAQGAMDFANGQIISGWAYDIDHGSPLVVHLYIDDAFVGGMLANQIRLDLNSIGMGDRAFTFATPPLTPGAHKIAVYAIGVNRNGGYSYLDNFDPNWSNPLLAGAPKTVMIQTVVTAPANGAVLSGATSTRITWAQTTDAVAYYVRMADLSDPNTRHPSLSAWGCAYVCTASYAGTSMDVPLVPGHSYRIWIHSIYADGNYTSGIESYFSVSQDFSVAWQALPGAALDVGVGANGAAWVIGTSQSIHYWDGSNWPQAPGGAVRIDVGPDGNPWVVNSAGSIFKWNGNGWDQFPGAALDIGIGANGAVWAIGTNQGIYHWNGSGWEQYPGGALRIDVGPDGNPWVVNSAGSIFRWTGGWEHIAGAAQDVGIGADGSVFITGADTTISKWNGSSWQLIPGNANQVSVGPSGIPWVVNANGTIFTAAP